MSTKKPIQVIMRRVKDCKNTVRYEPSETGGELKSAIKMIYVENLDLHAHFGHLTPRIKVTVEETE